MLVLTDGILLQTEAVRAETISKFLNCHDAGILEEKIFEYLHDADDSLASKLIHLHFGHVLPRSVWLAFDRLSADWNSLDVRAVKYAREFMMWLPRPSAIVSSLAEVRVAARLSKVGLEQWLGPHVILNCANRVDRDYLAGVYIDLAGSFQVDPAHCAVASNSTAEIRAAKAAGMRSIGFLGGSSSPTWHAGVLLASGADEVVCDLHSLKKSFVRFQAHMLGIFSAFDDCDATVTTEHLDREGSYPDEINALY